jgi:hypothetical protein
MRKLMMLGAVLGMIGLASSARANEILQIYEDGVLQQTLTFSSGTMQSHADVAGDLNYMVTVESNSPGTPSLANLQTVTVFGINQGASAHTFQLVFGDVNFTKPNAPIVVMQSSMSGTFGTSNPPSGTSTSDNATFTSYIDYSNTQQSGITGPAFTPDATTTSSATVSATSNGSFGNVFKESAPDKLVSSPGTTFSLTTLLTFHLNATEGLQVTGTESVVPSPEPASILLLCAAFPIAGVAGFYRRKLKKA